MRLPLAKKLLRASRIICMTGCLKPSLAVMAPTVSRYEEMASQLQPNLLMRLLVLMTALSKRLSCVTTAHESTVRGRRRAGTYRYM